MSRIPRFPLCASITPPEARASAGSIGASTEASTDASAGAAANAAFDLRTVATLLPGQGTDWSLEYVDETGSTNADLLARFAAGQYALGDFQHGHAPAWRPVARAAGVQTAGRGRHGRPWLAAAGDALLFSVAWPMPRPLSAIDGLSLALGTALSRALIKLPLATSTQLTLKWPNDLLLDGRKLAGILVETAGHTRQACALVIGIGINLRAAPGSAEFALDERAPRPLAPTALEAALPDGTARAALPERVLAACLGELDETLTRFAAAGFAPFRDAWQALDAFRDQMVSIHEQGRETMRGIACGVDASGRLLVDPGTGPTPVLSGDASARKTSAAS
ncbi:MAG: biotin--[acetyl-CoA-carboxylase] ligase [Janthinobacterium lividum]